MSHVCLLQQNQFSYNPYVFLAGISKHSTSQIKNALKFKGLKLAIFTCNESRNKDALHSYFVFIRCVHNIGVKKMGFSVHLCTFSERFPSGRSTGQF